MIRSKVQWTIALFVVTAVGTGLVLSSRPRLSQVSPADSQDEIKSAAGPRGSREGRGNLRSRGEPPPTDPADELSKYQLQFIRPALALLDDLAHQATSHRDVPLAQQVEIERRQLIVAARGIPDLEPGPSPSPTEATRTRP